MTKFQKIAFFVLAVCIGAIAQSFLPPSIGSNGPIATQVGQCGISAPHAWMLCPVETGPGTGVLYASVNGSQPMLVATGPQTGAVLSFNGHKPDASGNVAPAAGDYSYPMISNTPPPPPTLTFNGRPPDATFNFAPAAGDYNYNQITGTPNAVLDVNGQPGPHVKLTATTTVSLPPITPVAVTTIP